MVRPLRPLLWVASSKRDYRGFPAQVQDTLGFELFLAQTGQHPPSAKLLKGLGSGTVELIEDFDGDTYRAIYTVRFGDVIYVLHAFKKKSTGGVRTAQGDINLVKRRLKYAERDPCGAVQEGAKVMGRNIKVEVGSGNIFADLGLPDADTHLLKAKIVSEIYRIANERKLTQAQAGKRMGISQPEVSRMYKGNFREYSIDRLMAFLTSFDRDVEIVVKPHKRRGKAGRITFSTVAA